MPTKTIYIAKDDLEVFEAAKEKAGGNLSSVIVSALNEYVGRQDALESAKDKGFSEVIVTLGGAGYQHQKRFIGKRILSSFSGLNPKRDYKGFTIYQTRKGQYVVVACSLPDPYSLETGTSDPLTQAVIMDDEPTASRRALDILMGYGDGNFTEYATDYKLVVCPTLADVAKAVPEHIYKDLTDRLEQLKHPVEYLDV